MIQPNELRLGNCVQTPLGDIMIVTQLGHQDNKDFIGASQYKNGELVGFGMNRFEPIELTPEILENVGFEKYLIDESSKEYEYYYSMEIIGDKYCDLSFISGDKNGILEVCLFPYETWFRFQYLHQLQNIYYALTGKELDISKFIEQQ